MAFDIEKDLMEQLDIEVNKNVRGIKRAINKGLRYLQAISPVDTGWYVYNHRVSINGGSVPLNPGTRPPRGRVGLAMSGSALVSRESSELSQLKLGDTVSLINAVPYAGIIENIGTPTTPAGQYYERTRLFIETELGQPLNRAGGDGSGGDEE